MKPDQAVKSTTELCGRETSLFEICAVRHAVRIHRDQLGDYRCWVDDEVLYHRTLPELRGKSPCLPTPQEFTSLCEYYFACRQDPNENTEIEIPLDSRVGPLKLVYDNDVLNADLNLMNESQINAELATWQQRIRDHRQIDPKLRTFLDDQRLYLALPEKKLAVTKLPPRELFLGRGCPAYNSHCHAHPEDFERAVW